MDGTTDDLKGRAKEAAGDLTDNDDLKNEGKTDRGPARRRTWSTTSKTRPTARSTR